MKKNIIIFILLTLTIIGCSKDENPLSPANDSPELVLTLINSTSFSANFKFDFSSNLENVRLIWNDLDEVDLNNQIGGLEINQNTTDLYVNNLKESRTYYFKLVGTQNDQDFYSNKITATTSAIEILFNGQIASSIITNGIEEIIKKDDGYLIVTNPGNIYINKLDNDFNLLWSTEISERNSNNFKSIIDLENGEFIVFGSGNTNTNLGTYNTKSYAVKINSSGNKVWTKYYNYADNTDWTYWWNDIVKFKKRGSEIKLLTTVDTTYYNNRLDTFYQEYTLNNNGEIVAQTALSNDFNTFLNIEYDNNGNKYNYGTIDLTPDAFVSGFSGVLEKYDTNNNLIWHTHYNDEVFGSDRLDELLVNENNLINIGTQVDQYGLGTNKEEYRLIHFRDSQGNKLWEFTETRDDFLYQGKDIITDFNNTFLALYLDIYYPNSHVYNIATLMKFDIDGNLLWKYQDGEDFNQDNFFPSKVFKDNGEYLIFGVKDGNSLWLKKIKVE